MGDISRLSTAICRVYASECVGWIRHAGCRERRFGRSPRIVVVGSCCVSFLLFLQWLEIEIIIVYDDKKCFDDHVVASRRRSVAGGGGALRQPRRVGPP